jgi:hypothetical protein
VSVLTVVFLFVPCHNVSSSTVLVCNLNIKYYLLLNYKPSGLFQHKLRVVTLQLDAGLQADSPSFDV